MAKKLLFIIAIYLSISSKGQSQSFYALYNYGSLRAGLEKIDIATCDTTWIGYTLYGAFNVGLWDIAITPDNKLYGIGADNLYKIDTTNATLSLIATLNHNQVVNMNSLVSDCDGNLLAVNNDSIYQINRFTGQLICLGYYGNYNPEGDLTFYNDTLYLSAFEGLVKITLHPSITSQLIGIMSTYNIFALNTICINNTQIMLACAKNSSLNNSLYMVNPTNAKLTLLCDSITRGNAPGISIDGSASNCGFSFNTEQGCNTGFNIFTTNQDLQIFPNPASSQFNILYRSSDPLEVTLFDITSRQLLRQKFTSSVSLNIEYLADGIYLYQIKDKKEVIKQGKLVKRSEK